MSYPAQSASPAGSPRLRRSTRGFSVLELITVVAVGMILAAIATPIIWNITKTLRLNAAVSAVTGSMQSTRYRAIYDGCPYSISYFKDTNTYQIKTEASGGSTCAGSFSNVGTAVPFADPKRIALDQNLTFQFSPGGSVTVTTGANSFNLSHIGTTTTKNVKVTKYGSVTIQ